MDLFTQAIAELYVATEGGTPCALTIRPSKAGWVASLHHPNDQMDAYAEGEGQTIEGALNALNEHLS